MAHAHKAIERLTKITPFTGPVSRDENRAAHGNVTLLLTCSCSSCRAVNVNGIHREDGEWDLPEWVADQNPHAIAYTVQEARGLLQALSGSVAGCAAIEAACGDSARAVIEQPTRGDDASSLAVARRAWDELVGLARERVGVRVDRFAGGYLT